MPKLFCSAGIVAKKTGAYLELSVRQRQSPSTVRPLSVRCPSASVRCPSASVRLPITDRERLKDCHCDEATLSVRRMCTVRPLSVRCPSASVRCPSASVRCPSAFVRPQSGRTNQTTWTDSGRMRTPADGCALQRTAYNKLCRPSLRYYGIFLF